MGVASCARVRIRVLGGGGGGGGPSGGGGGGCCCGGGGVGPLAPAPTVVSDGGGGGEGSTAGAGAGGGAAGGGGAGLSANESMTIERISRPSAIPAPFRIFFLWILT